MGMSEPIEKIDQAAAGEMSLPESEEELRLAVALTATLETYRRYVSRGGSSPAGPDPIGLYGHKWQLMARWEQVHGQR